MSTAADIEYIGQGGALDATEARALTDQIKTGVEAVWHLITRAYTERAWTALGYQSWDDYCTREFGTSRLRLPREERQEVVSSLRESGLSLRAIAAATGVNRETVRQEIAAAGDKKLPPVEPVSSLQGDDEAPCIHCGEILPLSRLYEGGQGYECDPCVSPDDPQTAQREPVADPPKPVTGMDGKNYPPARPAPKPSQQETAPRRRPLTDAAREIGLDLKNLTSRMERLLADDRFARNKSEVAPHLRFHLAEVIRVCQDLENQINNQECI